MTAIEIKYELYRNTARNGDIILWKSNSLASDLIRYFDNFYINADDEKIKSPSYYTHISYVHWHRNRLENCDAWYEGITNVPMSHRIKHYVDFCVIRPTKINLVEHGINEGLNEWEAQVKYDYFRLLRIAIVKKTGIDITGLSNSKKYICSLFIQKYCENIGLKSYEFCKLMTPQDFIRFANRSIYKEEVEILLNDN